MRQLREQTRKSSVKFELTDDIIMTLGKILDTKDLLHIEEVYFINSGEHFFRKTSWKDPETNKTKDYAYLVMDTRPWITDGRGQQLYKLMRVGSTDQEIVFSISAEELVDKYIKLKNKK